MIIAQQIWHHVDIKCSIITVIFCQYLGNDAKNMIAQNINKAV